MESIFADVSPEVVFHAAAHKHVELMEDSRTGDSKQLLATSDCSLGERLEERFILISTDKAINPTSVMGATKRLAELALIEQQSARGNQPASWQCGSEMC